MSTRAVDILDSLPHRPPFRFITEVRNIIDQEIAQAMWRVTGEEPFFAGHFPGHPIVPGVLIGEALAQVCGLVVLDRSEVVPSDASASFPLGPLRGMLAHIDVRFNHTVTPPAEILLECKLDRIFGELWQFQTWATVNTRRVARGSLTLSVPKEDWQSQLAGKNQLAGRSRVAPNETEPR